ncbi:HEPN-associated N-terminal domain-containing protein [Streptomyces sp. NPDC015242]|uniref:HEPN-associated N-terminal domain-containing protein n=1 Tax=Streptomyces sp. NPDC015242 TaxID=3364951 RepID=UPI0036F54CF0
MTDTEEKPMPPPTGDSVCSRCVSDEALQAQLDDAAEQDLVCSFCGSGRAADFDVLLDAFMRGLRHEFNNVDDEGVPYDSREGGYQWGDIWDTWDLISYEFSDVLTGEGLLEAMQGAVEPGLWARARFIEPRSDEALMDSWQDFCEAIQHRTRYVFWQRPRSRDDDLRGAGEIPPQQILERIGDLITELGLVRRLDTSEQLWRARVHAAGEEVSSAVDLGTIPQALCRQSNRMSPAGIPMFYGASTAETALKEALVRPATEVEVASVGAFTCSREVTVVDFTKLPAVPSLFDPELGGMRRQVRFLHAFVEELAKEVRPTYEEIDYVPTQVVTEYLLHAWDADTTIAGLTYRSARTNAPCTVLNVRSERCFDHGSAIPDEGELHLMLHRDTVRTGSAPQQ